jgi:hypothetical protein
MTKNIKVIGSKVSSPIRFNAEVSTWGDVVEILAKDHNFAVDGLKASTISRPPITFVSFDDMLPESDTIIISLSPVKNDNGVQ